MGRATRCIAFKPHIQWIWSHSWSRCLSRQLEKNDSHPSHAIDHPEMQRLSKQGLTGKLLSKWAKFHCVNEAQRPTQIQFSFRSPLYSDTLFYQADPHIMASQGCCAVQWLSCGGELNPSSMSILGQIEWRDLWNSLNLWMCVSARRHSRGPTIDEIVSNYIDRAWTVSTACPEGPVGSVAPTQNQGVSGYKSFT